MPWESSWLEVADADEHGAVVPKSARKVVGGNGVSISQPRWSLDGKTILYLSDETGYVRRRTLDRC